MHKYYFFLMVTNVQYIISRRLRSTKLSVMHKVWCEPKALILFLFYLFFICIVGKSFFCFSFRFKFNRDFSPVLNPITPHMKGVVRGRTLLVSSRAITRLTNRILILTVFINYFFQYIVLKFKNEKCCMFQIANCNQISF